MELKNYLEEGAKKAGSLTALGKLLDLSQPYMSNAKAQKKPLPIDAVCKLAEFIGADLKAVIAANELVTEKKEEKRAYWRPFVEHARAAMLCATIASVVNVATPSPAEAAPLLEGATSRVCIMLSNMLRSFLEKSKLNRILEPLTKTFSPFFAVRAHQM